MSEQTPDRAAIAELDEGDVAAYLETHRDFLVRHPDLVGTLEVPHETGAAVSLVERQVQLLREANRGLQQRLQQLARTARGNEVLLERLQVLILRLIDSRDLDAARAALEDGLREDFHADFIVLHLIGPWPRPEALAPDDPALAPLQAVLTDCEPICGYTTPEQRAALFAEAAAEVASAILLPLCEGPEERCLGLLAVGSVDPMRFHPDMGTVFVTHLGAVAARIFRRHLEG